MDTFGYDYLEALSLMPLKSSLRFIFLNYGGALLLGSGDSSAVSKVRSVACILSGDYMLASVYANSSACSVSAINFFL